MNAIPCLVVFLAMLGTAGARAKAPRTRFSESKQLQEKLLVVRFEESNKQILTQVCIVKPRLSPPIPAASVTLEIHTVSGETPTITSNDDREFLIETMGAGSTAVATYWVVGTSLNDLASATVFLGGDSVKLKVLSSRRGKSRSR
jgi:hypothetical protein